VKESTEVLQNVKSSVELFAESRNFKLLCSMLNEASSGIDGNVQKFTTQEYVAQLGSHLKLQATDGDRFRMNTGAIVLFGKNWSKAFNHVPACHFVLGALKNDDDGESVTRKRVVKRPASQKAKEKGATKIANIGKSQTVEALTDKYVKITKKALGDNYAKKEKPLCYFSFVIDPDSFCKTVENMFHVSFLVKQRLAVLAIGGNGMPTIEPYSGEDSDSDEEGESAGFGMDQAVIDICQADWYELKTNLKITSKMIDTSS